MAECRRILIAFVYIQLLGEPSITPEVISKITKVLCIPPKSRRCVSDVVASLSLLRKQRVMSLISKP